MDTLELATLKAIAAARLEVGDRLTLARALNCIRFQDPASQDYGRPCRIGEGVEVEILALGVYGRVDAAVFRLCHGPLYDAYIASLTCLQAALLKCGEAA